MNPKAKQTLKSFKKELQRQQRDGIRRRAEALSRAEAREAWAAIQAECTRLKGNVKV